MGVVGIVDIVGGVMIYENRGENREKKEKREEREEEMLARPAKKAKKYRLQIQGYN